MGIMQDVGRYAGKQSLSNPSSSLEGTTATDAPSSPERHHYVAGTAKIDAVNLQHRKIITNSKTS